VSPFSFDHDSSLLNSSGMVACPLLYSRGSVCRPASSWRPNPARQGGDVLQRRLWKDELENVLMPMLEQHEVVVVEDSEELLKWGLAAAEDFRQEHVNNDAH
jgi:hypothetical protein